MEIHLDYNMKYINKTVLEDSLPEYILFFTSEPNILYIEHEGQSIVIYYEMDDAMDPSKSLLEYKLINVYCGQHVNDDFKFIGKYKYKSLINFLYIKRVK